LNNPVTLESIIGRIYVYVVGRKKMKKLYLMIVLIFLALVGCSNESEQGAADHESQETEVEKNASEPIEENAKPSEEELVETKLPERSFITLEEFDQLFEQDPSEEQWIDGKFQLADDTIVYADYLSYGKSDLFDHATTIFYGGKLAYIQLETNFPPEVVLSSLSITQDQNAAIEPNPNGFEITFDDKFHEKNINIYPFEWE
jgi:hypothetical protein